MVNIRTSDYLESFSDELTADQFIDLTRRSSDLSCEQRLMFAVLVDAINIFQKYLLLDNKQARKLFQEVEKWFNSKDNSWPFSFENVCNNLKIDPDYLQRGLARWKSQKMQNSTKVIKKINTPYETRRYRYTLGKRYGKILFFREYKKSRTRAQAS